MDTTCSLHRPQNVADGSQLGGKIGSIVRRTWLRVLDDTVVIGTTMLADVFIGIAVVAVQVRWKFGEQGDDVAAVSPSSEHNNVSFGHRASPHWAV
jgi:hypothetical protein